MQTIESVRTEPASGVGMLSAAVVTHPGRLDHARRVAGRFRPLEARLAVDPDPTGRPGALRAARLAFCGASTEASHHLVVQDDVSIPDGFVDAVRRTCQLYPDAAVSYFVEWGSPTATLARWAAFTGASAVPAINTYMPTQALSLPSRHALELGEFLCTETKIGDADDEQILRFLRQAGLRKLVVVPNLVEHLDLPCTTGHGWQGARLSVCLEPDAPVPAKATLLDLPVMVPFFQWTMNISMMVCTEPGANPDWRPTVEVLAAWGRNRVELIEGYQAAWRSQLDREVLEYRIGDESLFQLWITAVAMGAIQADRWPDSLSVLDAVHTHPRAARALRTMAPGALRRIVGLDFLDRHAEQLDALLVDGMKYGAARCDTNPAAG